MGLQSFPTSSGGTSYSSQPPASASSVLLDGQIITTSPYSTTITGTGAPLILYANGASSVVFTITGVTGSPFTVTAGSTVGTPAITGSTSVSISAATLPVAFGIYNGATVRA